ncbi:MAG: SDR family oxidoreductase [Actinomycetia bacterium]|nr:SDR family oxidoreductase [Actinomycetes bacterium]
MDSFAGRIAIVTGGGTGMGRDLVHQLAAEGCHVAACDVSMENLTATRESALAGAAAGTRITVHQCDVSDEAQVMGFRDEVVAQHETDHVNLVFNNAGIGGGGSFVDDERSAWERTFEVCWGGVYLCSRAFVPLLVASDEGWLINTASINGFWATVGPHRPHTAYSAAKFAVKGFSEALINDFRLNAPHVGVSVVMPGHIGTDIVLNSLAVHGGEADPEVTEIGNAFRSLAPTTAAQAATVILDGVRAKRWRILVGDDAHIIDDHVRETPEAAYEPEFFQRIQAAGALNTFPV